MHPLSIRGRALSRLPLSVPAVGSARASASLACWSSYAPSCHDSGGWHGRFVATVARRESTSASLPFELRGCSESGTPLGDRSTLLLPGLQPTVEVSDIGVAEALQGLDSQGGAPTRRTVKNRPT